jgi:hypothetical protein
MRVDVLGSSMETGMLYKHGRDHEKGAPMKRPQKNPDKGEDPNYFFSEFGG